MARAGSGATLANHDWRRQVLELRFCRAGGRQQWHPAFWSSGTLAERAFWEESRGQSAEFFHDYSPSLPRHNDCVTADGSRCLIPRSFHLFRPHRDGNPPDSPRDESPRPPTSRCRVVARLTDVPASRHTASKSHEAVTASCMLPDSPKSAEPLSHGSNAIANTDNLPLDVRRKPATTQEPSL